jgi:predicted N-formylglutamate amidohydrolase
MPLLIKGDPGPVILERQNGPSPFFISCDHAGNAIPQALGNLGLSAIDCKRHIAWDIGALGVARELSRATEACMVAQPYSRLVVDCNRPKTHPELVVCRSESTDVPGNQGVSSTDRKRREIAIYDPYHQMISNLLDSRLRDDRATIFVSVHSFTPVYRGISRPWEVGILYGRDDRLATQVLHRLNTEQDLCVGDNEPYRIDEKDLGLPEHAIKRGLLNVLFEIRQDLIVGVMSQKKWGLRLASVLRDSVRTLESGS